MKKPDFKDIYFDPDQVCWGRGNKVVGPQLLARIELREPTSEEEKEEMEEYTEAKEIYDKYINKGQRFKSSGPRATGVQCVITYIHPEKQLVTWKQDNLTDEETERGMRPARGKWPINSVISLFKAKEIEFI